MKRISPWIVLAVISAGVSGCDLWLLGSEKTGYRMDLKVNHIEYSNMHQLEQILLKRNYTFIFKERGKAVPRYPGEVYSLYAKTLLVSRKEEIVDVYLHYVKDESNDLVHHVWVDIRNWYRGGIVPELKHEIDETGNSIYQEIVARVGREHVTLSRFGEAAQK